VKFLYSDTQDYVDPDYDFELDEHKPGRRRYWDDRYAHELMEETPYDGLLVSMSAIKAAKGVSASKGRYSAAEEQRLQRVGARKFLRFDGIQHRDKMLMGDCGAFAYADQPKPAYSPEEVVEFYANAEFTHGCHPDHIIFNFMPDNPSRQSAECRVAETGGLPGASIGQRFDVTLANAREFLRYVGEEGNPFEPIGVVQGWSPESMAEAAAELEAMGYRYLAIGGLVPLKTPEIHLVLQAIRARIRSSTAIHLLGFAKADQIHEFTKYGVASFDSTSPLIRAFKDARRNYYLPGEGGKLEYFAAIRIPQAIENTRMVQAIKRGTLNATDLQIEEQVALAAIRGFDKGDVGLEEATKYLSRYQGFMNLVLEENPEKLANLNLKTASAIEGTLRAAPWKRCRCSICRAIGVEVIIFRSANRNRRRGFHNLGVYHSHVRQILESQS
jgi:hypothetical protein